MRKGWFKIDGVQHGDRTLEEQMRGLAPAITAARGKSVLDLGCAEGLIAREFALAGAASVMGIELLKDHIDVAREQCRGLATNFVQASLQEWIEAHPNPERYDVVLALGIAHKLHKPADLITFACQSAISLIVFRGPGKEDMYWDGWLWPKHRGSQENKCHVPTIMAGHGFEEGETLKSAQGERVQYWWRKQ